MTLRKIEHFSEDITPILKKIFIKLDNRIKFQFVGYSEGIETSHIMQLNEEQIISGNYEKLPDWAITLSKTLFDVESPDVESPTSTGNYQRESLSPITISVGSPNIEICKVIDILRVTDLGSDGNGHELNTKVVKRDKLHQCTATAFYEGGELTWEYEGELDERTLGILNAIPVDVLGFTPDA